VFLWVFIFIKGELRYPVVSGVSESCTHSGKAADAFQVK